MIKRKIVVLSACFAAASLFMVSCGSTKEPEPAPVEDTAEEQAEEETPAEENTDAIDSIWASVDSSRQDAIDAGAENAAADLFAAAEVEYNKLKNSKYHKRIVDAEEREIYTSTERIPNDKGTSVKIKFHTPKEMEHLKNVYSDKYEDYNIDLVNGIVELNIRRG